MSEVSAESQTTYANVDWEEYVRSRPVYPESLKKIVYRYRSAQRAAGWERVVDIGGGVGISSTLFAADFKIVHLLDPGPSNHRQAREFLTQWLAQRDLRTQLEFTLATAERGHEFIHDADLLICAETAHFVEPRGLVDSAARMLRPGATMAIYSYWFPVFPDQSLRLSEAFGEAVTRTLGLCIDLDDSTSRSFFGQVAARVSAGGRGVLDCISVPREYFADVQRISINPAAEQQSIEIFARTFPVPFEPLPSRSDELKLVYNSNEDVEAEGWCFPVDDKWLHKFLGTLRPASVNLEGQEYERIYGKLDQILAQECASASVRSLWPVSVLLATRNDAPISGQEQF